MYEGNYSAAEEYDDSCRSFDKKRVDVSQVKPRWFRNFYVLHQTKGWFTHNTWVFSAKKLPDNYLKFSGEWFGPFFESDAKDFAYNVKTTHENFIMGGD